MILTSMGLRVGRRVIPCSIGRGGITADKREGDGATPMGVHRIAGLLYRPDRVVQPAGWAQPILPGDLWCDAPAHPAYNHPVRAPFSASHEAMRRADPLYDVVLVTDWNRPFAQAGKGSAIFVHQWRRPGFPTAGCIAMARRDLIWLAARVRPGDVLEVPALPRWPARQAVQRTLMQTSDLGACPLPLGSRLIDFHSQKMTVAARAMAERNTLGQRS